VSPRTLLRPHLTRASTTTLAAAGGALMSVDAPPPAPDPFHTGATISINQPVGSLSISPSSRDVCLASRKGLYILDLANLESAPRFVPQGGTWQIADVQWSPHAVTDNLILSTSCQKLLVWDLAANTALNRSIEAHERAITDINWHALNPNMMATVGMDAAVRAWDLRHDCKRPAVRLSAWGAAGTQVKWNRLNEYVLATAHHREVLLWDTRKGSVPVDTVKAHDSKIYGIDWDRVEAHKLVTCSLDKSIKYWSIPSLSGGRDSTFYPYHYETVNTNYPVWRARHLPFGQGVLALPQRGETALEMFGIGGDTPLHRFEGSSGVVKEFVWRIRGGNDLGVEDREFQLVTWSKDRKLRIWNVPREVTEKAGYKPGAPIPYRSSRLGAKNRTFTAIPGGDVRANGIPLRPQGAQSSSPVFNFGMPAGPSGIARQRLLAHTQREAGMTRGGGQARKIDQLEWLTKIVPTDDHAKTASTAGSRTPSVSERASERDSSGSRSRSITKREPLRPLSASTRTPSRVRGEKPEKEELMSLKEEVVLVHKRFPRSKVNFERVSYLVFCSSLHQLDLTGRKLTMSMNGPWANGNRVAFVRIHWSFPQNYPYGNEIPTFELERNATVSQITRQRMVSTIKEIRSNSRQCLVSVTEFLLGYHERTGRRALEEESDSDNDDVDVNVPMLIRTTGAVFGPNGQLACFFPKQTVLPRARTSLSRSPSGQYDPLKSRLARAMNALSRMENPHKPAVSLRFRRRREKAMVAPVLQRSLLTLRNVSHLLSEPDMALAAVYTTTSPETNFRAAVDGRRLDHAEVWQTVHGVLSDPPPPYSDLPALRGTASAPRERMLWERDMERKRRVLDELFERLMAAADIQLLALVACMLAEYDKAAPPPPPAIEEIVQKSPERGYFVLPDRDRRSSSLTPTTPPVSAGPSSFRTSGWSQILMNPSSISLRGMTLTPRDRSSFEIPNRTSVGSVDDSSIQAASMSPGRRMNIPPRRQNSTTSAGSLVQSPRQPRLDRRDSAGRELTRTMSRDVRPRPLSGTNTSPPTTAIPPTPSRLATATNASEPSSDGSAGPGGVRHKVSFGGSGSPLRRAFSRAPNLPAMKRRSPTCSVRIDLNIEEGYVPHYPCSTADPRPSAPASLLRPELRPQAELWKLAYADLLLRAGLVGKRAALLQYEFTAVEGHTVAAASGDLPQQELVLASMCRFCNEHVLLPDEVRCQVCARYKEPPLCGVCRLPIKGESKLFGPLLADTRPRDNVHDLLAHVAHALPTCGDGEPDGPLPLLPVPLPRGTRPLGRLPHRAQVAPLHRGELRLAREPPARWRPRDLPHAAGVRRAAVLRVRARRRPRARARARALVARARRRRRLVPEAFADRRRHPSPT
jgi:WD40 repeat protein